MEDNEVVEASVSKDSKKDSSEEAVNSAVEVSQPKKNALNSYFVPAKKGSAEELSDSDSGGGEEEEEESDDEGKDDQTEQHSSLLPTPPMPHNWLDPSRKHVESDVSADEEDKAASELVATHDGQGESNLDGAQREEENKSNSLSYSQENEPERPTVLPEKICSPLLPTPLMPENWLDPSRRSTDSSFPAFSDGNQTSPFFQTECGGDLPANSFLPEANMNLNDHFLSSSATTYTDTLCPQASLFPNDNSQSQNNSTFDPYAEYNEQTMQDRNFKAKSNPVWNKQVRQAQPYYRPQPQSAYGATNYTSQLNERPAFQSNQPGTLNMNMNSSYMYNTQPTNERREVQQWKY